MANVALEFYDLYCEEVEKNERLVKENASISKRYRATESRYNHLEKHIDEIIEKKENDTIKIQAEEIDSLKNEVARLKSLLNNDSTNSGIPTSKTPISKNKKIPNSRKKSSKKKGGQTGHKQYKLMKFDDCQITDTVEHKVEECPECFSKMIPTGKVVYKDEFEIIIKVRKIRHVFMEMRCPKCGYTIMEKIPARLKEENQYGYQLQALALDLVNIGFVSINRTREIISGLTGNEINLSEGYIAKLQKRLAQKLEPFVNELKQEIVKQQVVHWDDTVIMITSSRACLRFYGDDQLALYAAHIKKDKVGIDSDLILTSLDDSKVVVHDHNKVNYNDDYEFQNAECCVHLLRDLKKVIDNLNHGWAKEMIDLLVEANIKRKTDGETIDPELISLNYDIALKNGESENTEEKDRYYVDTEKTLIKRLKEYKMNYLMWTVNEEIPFSNNISERSLRSSKTKMKVSGQFNNLNTARYYATIKSYLETGKRHGINTTYLITRALDGKYVTIEEMKKAIVNDKNH